MKKYELIKNRSEFMWKDRFEIRPGCTYHQDNPDPECIASYESSEIALEELKRYHTDISKLSGGAGTFYSVTEYYVQVSEYDADGNWLSEEIYDWSDIGIALVDESSHDEVAFFDNLQDAEQALQDYDGEAFLSLNDFPETDMLKNITKKDIQISDQMKIAGITWSKFAEDENGNAYMLADEPVGFSEFGDSNDYQKSKIRDDLKIIAQKIIAEIGEEAIVPVEIDLLSHDGLDDYGKIIELVSLLTYDLYRHNRKNIKPLNDWWWLATPDSTPSGYSPNCIQYVASFGGVDCGGYSCDKAVRPFFILKSCFKNA